MAENKLFYKTKDCYIHRKIAGNDVLISVGENVANFNGYVELSPTASVIWDALAVPNNIDGLTEAVVAEFEIDPEIARADVKAFVDELLDKDMIARAEVANG